MSMSNQWQFAVNVIRHSRPPAPSFIDKDYPDLTGKVFLVTGGSSGIGYEVVKKLLAKNAKVWILARNKANLDKRFAELKKMFPRSELETVLVDLADLASIGPGIQVLLKKETKLHGIIHNAGVSNPPADLKTKQGYGLQLGINAVGTFLLQKFLDDIVIATAKAEPPNTVRILWVSTAGHLLSPPNGGINWDDINFEHSKESWNTLYGQSKAIVIYLSYLWAKKHPESGVVSICCHPGVIEPESYKTDPPSRIERAVISVISPMYPPDFGAYTELFAILSPTLTTADNGTYLIPWGNKGDIRKDIKEGMKGKNGERIWTWLDKQVAEYE
ncbi:DEKNAAC103117 [Brettanomyces naardenensis]|uniref:DEKNAAC103117 n=1 Tax=Brettanomyces naardenensis TaxID=13370 RepID=A0A448YMM1_BRENA|nr:DEKNAAC103117 [Brettanomyces naardenensis]